MLYFLLIHLKSGGQTIDRRFVRLQDAGVGGGEAVRVRPAVDHLAPISRRGPNRKQRLHVLYGTTEEERLRAHLVETRAAPDPIPDRELIERSQT